MEKTSVTLLHNHKGFTLAETLITLVIIGIVAALTLPALVNNHRKEFVETRLKSAYSILANMFKSAEVDYGTLNTWDFNEFKEQTTDFDGKRDTFVNKYMLPYLKISSDKAQSFSEFGYKKISYPNGNDAYNLSVPVRIITLNNGMVFWISLGGYSLSNSNYVCTYIEICVDIDGPNKGSNTIGKDIFIFVQPFVKGHPLTMSGEIPFSTCFFTNNLTDSLISTLRSRRVCAYAINQNTGSIVYTGLKQTREEILNNCVSGTYFSKQCGALIRHDGWRIADDYPWL